jgi:threonine dehydratase
VLRTPLRPSPWLSTEASAEVRLKLETLQPTSSYKIRGAFNAVLKMARAHDGSQLVTASAGNHGRALAWAVQAEGMSLTVYVPEHAPRTKIDAIAESGAQLVRCRDYDEAERRAKEHALREGAVFISPYNHADIIAGAGTIGLEIIEEWPEVDLIVVPIGGGGLISGIALAVKGSSPRTEVDGVEVEASCPFTRGLAAGRIVEIDVQPTLADGLAGNLDPDTVTFDIVRREVARIAVVNEDHLRNAIAGVMENEHLVTEGAGAVGVAALLSARLDVRGKRVAVVLSGANIDQGTLSEIV